MKRKAMIIIAIVIAVFLCTGIVLAKTMKPDLAYKDLSDEDIVLKTKIAEISDTKVDFRHNKQEEVQGKKYDISFSEFNSNESAVRQVVYKNDLNDEFKYNIKTGKLYEFDIDSIVVEKTEDSIDIDTAHKIALEYLPKNCNIDEYTQRAYKETESGYFFWYERYIGKYSTMDSFSIVVGFDGLVVSYKDATEDIDWKKIDIDEKHINAKIKEYADKHGISQIQGDYVCLYKEKVCVWCSFGDEYEDITCIALE